MNTFPNVAHLLRYLSYSLSSYKIGHISVINRARKVWFVPFGSFKYQLYDAGNFVWAKEVFGSLMACSRKKLISISPNKNIENLV